LIIGNKKLILKYITCAAYTYLIFVSFSANASLFNTLNGINYEWLEISKTVGYTRNQIELKSIDSNDALYGYTYASRQLVKELLYSYSNWDGLNGYHGDSNVVAGMASFMDDFGFNATYSGNGIDSGENTVDGYTRFVDGGRHGSATYGSLNECGYQLSCNLIMSLQLNVAGTPLTAYQWEYSGWSSSTYIPKPWSVSDSSTSGAFLVKVSMVPSPPAVWLMGSGLLGLMGFSRKNKVQPDAVDA
jgi:hypothetical protein